jgi:protein-tyrosine phosphatase
LTVLPGKRGISARYPGVVFRRDLDRDLATLRASGVGYLLLLVEDAELDRWGDPRIVERGRAAGIELVRAPLADGDAPSDVEAMDAMLDGLDAARRRGHVAIACLGGVGRTGTVAACAMVRSGLSVAKAIATVRRVRHPEAVETRRQEAFVAGYAEAKGGRGGRG